MSEDLEIIGSSPIEARVAGRRVYVRPELVEFGSVNELTRGPSGPVADGNRGRRARPGG
jgi:hypothetical protein